ncbi:MAG: efflux RND transporter periplasmic adaptor subunit [Planctomycetia bacterium]|nr:efflux RND transporter periplasmic adaptor subunit [Planctomycetia bacterium]
MFGLKNFLNLFSLCLTALFLGGAVGFYATYSFYKNNLSSEKYVAQLYESLKENGTIKPPVARQASLVRVTPSEWGPAQEYRTILGRLVEIDRSTVCSEVSGKVVEMSIEEGTPVEGDVTQLARIDSIWNALSIDESKAKIAALRATMDYESSELKRSSDLITSQAVSQSEFESNAATIQELKAQIDAEETRLKEYELKVKRSVILAPFTGTVIQRYVDVGSYVSAGTPIAEVISSGSIDARIYVPEMFIQRIQVGQELEIQIDPLKKKVKGTVVLIVGSAETASRTFPVRVRMDDEKGMLKPGMSVRADIPVTDRFDAVLVPKDAVLIRPDGNTVWVVQEKSGKDGKPETVAVPVPVDILADLRTGLLAVKSQTEEGLEILKTNVPTVIEGAERLSPGMTVRIVESPYELQPFPGLYDSGQQKKK